MTSLTKTFATRAFGVLVIGLMALTPGLPQAEEAAKAKEGKPLADVGNRPSMTTASYGDWTVRCVIPEDGQGGRSCELVQAIQVQGQPNPIAQIAIGYPLPGKQLEMAVVLPTDVSLSSAPKISADSTDAAEVATVWQRCVPGACFASAPLDEAALTAWKVNAKQGVLVFANAAGQQAKLQFSFRGLKQALDSLVTN